MCEEDLFENLLQEILYTHASGHTDKWEENEFREWLRPIVEETYEKARKLDVLIQIRNMEPKEEDYPDEDDYAEAYGGYFSAFEIAIDSLDPNEVRRET